MGREIIFLNRAYNDMDIQASLIDSFGETGAWNIRVIGYPCDGYMGHPSYHECAQYLIDKHNVSFESVMEHPKTPLFLKWLYKLERTLFKLKNKSFINNIIKIPYIIVLQLLFKLLKRNTEWLENVTKQWNPEILIIDEAGLHADRSYMIDKILPELAKRGTHIHAIQTGQTTYFDANPNKATSENPITTRAPFTVKHFYVPSALDKAAVNETTPHASPEIQGNLRMDKRWIEKLHNEILVPPVLDKTLYLERLPQGNPRVVFMLSKLGYGIKLDEMKSTIRTVAEMKGVACAIKPHTRGMKFDFMNERETQSCAIVPDIPSALLIEWADIILITGSSIAFHAMIKGKRVGYLQNCQYIKTVFDDGAACDKFDSVEQLQEFLQDWQKNGEPKQTNDVLKTQKEWQTANIFAGRKDGLTAKHYRDMILKGFEK
jgi:hypothetical protein